MINTLTCGFIGLGLIGGSIAKAIRHHLPDTRLIAYDIHTKSLNLAVNEQVIDQTCPAIDDSFGSCDYVITEEINETFSSCDIVFLCAPVSRNAENLLALKPFLSPETILTDVGSVKTGIHRQIEELQLQKQFIGGHPMAGSERFGYQNAKASLLENAYYILTPSEEVPSEKVEAYRALVESMGAIPLTLSYGEHDYVTAAISHLPHVIAASLVNLVRDSDNGEGIMKLVAAGGFKDITRIASSSAAMWQQICLTNTENISRLLDSYIDSLSAIRDQLNKRQGEALYQFFDSARIYRDSFINASSGPIKRVYSFSIDIDDRPGMLAQVATTLAFNNINIKNIGIVHNREYEEGVLRIEFYDEASQEAAKNLLSTPQFVIHEKKF